MAADETETTSWLPALAGLSLDQIAALNTADLKAPVDQLKTKVVRPVSTIAGSDGS